MVDLQIGWIAKYAFWTWFVSKMYTFVSGDFMSSATVHLVCSVPYLVVNRCWFKENTCICFVCLTRLFLLIDMRFNCCEFRLADSFWSWVNYIVMSLSVWCTYQCQIKQDMQFRLQLCFLFYVCFAMQKLIVYNIRLQLRLHLHFSFRVLLRYYMLYSEKLQTDFLQMVMAVFAYIYYQSFVMVQDLSVETILEQVIWIRRVFIPWLQFTCAIKKYSC